MQYYTGELIHKKIRNRSHGICLFFEEVTEYNAHEAFREEPNTCRPKVYKTNYIYQEVWDSGTWKVIITLFILYQCRTSNVFYDTSGCFSCLGIWAQFTDSIINNTTLPSTWGKLQVSFKQSRTQCVQVLVSLSGSHFDQMEEKVRESLMCSSLSPSSVHHSELRAKETWWRTAGEFLSSAPVKVQRVEKPLELQQQPKKILKQRPAIKS